MKCEKMIEYYLKQEQSDYLPLIVRWHMLFCPGCRSEVRKIRNVVKEAGTTSLYKIPVDMSDLIMNEILMSNVQYDKDVSSLRWFFAGLLIFLSIFLVSYSDSLIWLKGHLGSGLEIPLNLVLGIAITVYAVFYIGTHLEQAKKLVDFINSKIHQ